jgi:hypothetical protein
VALPQPLTRPIAAIAAATESTFLCAVLICSLPWDAGLTYAKGMANAEDKGISQIL